MVMVLMTLLLVHLMQGKLLLFSILTITKATLMNRVIDEGKLM